MIKTPVSSNKWKISSPPSINTVVARIGGCILLFLAPLWLSAKELSITYFQTDQRYTYRIELLKSVLENTIKSHGPYNLQPLKGNITQGRGERMLESGAGIDVAFLPTNISRETRLQPIKIPILDGILGYRVLLIRKSSQAQFSSINSLEEFNRLFTGGFGQHWADMAILKHNKLNVFGAAKYETLFQMLHARRFDYFPRGINEAWQEVEKKGAEYPSLAVEKDLALYYPYYVYFFVNKDNKKLAERIETGLHNLQENGEFRALFMAYHKDLIDRSNISGRRMFILENPTLPQANRPKTNEWWIQLPAQN